MNGVAFPSPFPTQHMITESMSVAAYTLGPTTLESEVGESLRFQVSLICKVSSRSMVGADCESAQN